MSKQHEIKRKLSLIKQQGMPQVVTDVVRLCDTLLLEADEGTDEEYARVATKVLQKLREQYKGQLIEVPSVKQMDIETAIENAYKEAEERFPQTLKQLGDG